MFDFVVVNQIQYRGLDAAAIKQNTKYDNIHNFDHVCTDINSQASKFPYK